MHCHFPLQTLLDLAKLKLQRCIKRPLRSQFDRNVFVSVDLVVSTGTHFLKCCSQSSKGLRVELEVDMSSSFLSMGLDTPQVSLLLVPHDWMAVHCSVTCFNLKIKCRDINAFNITATMFAIIAKNIGKLETTHEQYFIKMVHTISRDILGFYLTQVYLGSDLWVRVSQTPSKNFG